MKGTAHVYERNHINTDEIIPARYLNTDDEQELASHAMEDLDESFPARVKSGDIIVAGTDFGCGSSREHAVWALRGAGIACVVAESYARIFYRNAINNGFPAIVVENATSRVSDGDEVEIDLRGGVLKNITQNTEVTFTPLPEFAIKIADAGGLLESIRE